MVSERVEKSSAVCLSGEKHSTEGGGELLDTAGRRDCPKSQVTKGRQIHTLILHANSLLIHILYLFGTNLVNTV